jgi:hypothetical protein
MSLFLGVQNGRNAAHAPFFRGANLLLLPEVVRCAND